MTQTLLFWYRYPSKAESE